jgi:putative glutamine amidotransferase
MVADRKRPVVGVTARTLHLQGSKALREAETLLRAYTEVLEAAGALPIILPTAEDPGRAAEYVELCDGLLFSGGDDPKAQLFGEEPHPSVDLVDERRDLFEIELARAARECDLPMLGVCRGIQILNVAFGGDIYQDLVSQTDSTVAHVQKTLGDRTWHTVDVAPGTRLADIVGAGPLEVNSFHHQACRSVGERLIVSSQTVSDGLIESIEDPDASFCIAVQWHPEISAQVGDPASQAVFEAFVRAAELSGGPVASNFRQQCLPNG